MTLPTFQIRRLPFAPAWALGALCLTAAALWLAWPSSQLETVAEKPPEPKQEAPKVTRTVQVARVTLPKPVAAAPKTSQPRARQAAPRPPALERSPAPPEPRRAEPDKVEPPKPEAPRPKRAEPPKPEKVEPPKPEKAAPTPEKVVPPKPEKVEPAPETPRHRRAKAEPAQRPARRPKPEPARPQATPARAPRRAAPSSNPEVQPARAREARESAPGRRSTKKVAAAFSLRLPSRPAQLRAFANAHGARFAVARTTGRKAELVKWLGWRGNRLVPVSGGGGGGLIRKLRDRRQLQALGDPAAVVARQTGLPARELFVEVFLDSARVRSAMAAALTRAGVPGATLDAQIEAAHGAHVICRGTPTGAIECSVRR